MISEGSIILILSPFRSADSLFNALRNNPPEGWMQLLFFDRHGTGPLSARPLRT